MQSHNPQICRGTPQQDQEGPPPRTQGTPHQQGKKRCRRFKKYNPDSAKFIVNLSNKILSPDHLAVLSKGLNFIPTPTLTNPIHTLKDTLMFNRRTRLRHHFQNFPEYSPDPTFPRANKGWVPPSGVDPDIDSFTHYLTQQMSKPVHLPHNKHSNLSPNELTALKDLKEDHSITIKPADKGGATVVWGTSAYEEEAMRQLNNTSHYKKTSALLTYEHHKLITSRLRALSIAGLLPEHADKFMINQDCRISPFYLLPKIHKINNPGRPIVSGIDSPTDRISATVDNVLRPYVKKIPSYIKDTRDFLNKLEKIGSLHDDEYFVTIDVSSLYTSIPHDEGILAISETLSRDPPNKVSWEIVTELVEMTLKMNTFSFNHKYYHQIQGTAMGTRMAPSYANIFMGHLEQRLLSETTLQPNTWLRYIDDIFAIYRGSEDEIKDHITHLNSLHHTIKFTSEINRDSIDFLDVTVFRGPNNKILTKVFVKPTNTGQYLHASSFHPRHQIQSIAFSQAIRLRLICSLIQDFDSASNSLLKNLTLCGHNHHKTKLAIARARDTNRDTLLHPPQRPPKKIIPFILTYSPHNRSAPHILKQALSFLRPSPANKKFLEYRMLVAYRRSLNLRDLIVSSTHPPPKSKSQSKPCHRTSCKICDQVVSTSHITSPSTNKKYRIVGNNSCDSFSIVYAITCPVCHMTYIGQTGRNIRERIYEHKRDITKRLRHQPVAKHFVDHDVQAHNMLITLLDNSSKDRNSRLRLEEAWIRILDTLHPNGINVHL